MRNFSKSLIAIYTFLQLSTPALAFDQDFEAHALSDEELSEVRGAFISAGGIQIDFAINTKTIIDDQLVRELEFGTLPGQQDVDPNELKQVIQIGGGNEAIPQEVLDSLPNIVTIIQNSKDGTVIQNINTLDISVSNARVYYEGNTSSIINQGTIDSLR